VGVLKVTVRGGRGEAFRLFNRQGEVSGAGKEKKCSKRRLFLVKNLERVSDHLHRISNIWNIILGRAKKSKGKL